MKIRRALGMFLVGAAFWLEPASLQAQSAELPAATDRHLPRWRGFNLLEKFSKGYMEGPFHEEDFRLISQWGFNFVRLPMDYREWIVDGDWTRFNEPVLKEIDQAVAWGRKYHVHVCINFHRAPGYTVAKPPEKLSVFKDAEALRVCALHWAYFARRYKGIPNENLSFNLFNEPADVPVEDYVRVVKFIAAAIRAEDPNRLIVCDGLDWGNVPVPELAPVHVAESMHDYQPMSVTHYQASWIEGSNDFPTPSWPVLQVNGYIYGPEKPDLASPFCIEGGWSRDATLRLHVGTVSGDATLAVRADGRAIFEKTFHPGPGAGEWEKSVYHPEYKIYQNIYNKDYDALVPAGTHTVEIVLARGDWLTVSRIEIVMGGHTYSLGTQQLWGGPREPVRFNPDDPANPFDAGTKIDRQYKWEHQVVPWQRLEAQGVGVMVGEFGVYNHTPHEVALAWMRDNLENWKRAGFGWALWNFRGPFGVLDSDRGDVTYETIGTHKLDRAMLQLLQQY